MSHDSKPPPSSDLSPKDAAQSKLRHLAVEPRQVYRHYKGGLYIILATAVHEELLTPMVVYWSVHKRSAWVRTYQNFCSMVEVDGAYRKRFELME